MNFLSRAIIFLLFFPATAFLSFTQEPSAQNSKPLLVQGTLIEPGGHPFHLKADVSEGRERTPVAKIEIFWNAPDQWKRTIVSQEFSQTVVVNGAKRYEKNSDAYFPVRMQALISAMTNPDEILRWYQPGDSAQTKANGASDESGKTCIHMPEIHTTLCRQSEDGLTETVKISGHLTIFMKYRKFHGKRIARHLGYTVSVGDSLSAEIVTLEDLKNPVQDLFSVESPTPLQEQLHAVRISENQLRSMAVESPQIIWPQVLDGAVRGKATFYVCLDRTGKIRDVLPIATANERSNDSAIRQLKRWKFTSPTLNGLPIQAEGVLTFDINTRAWGPADVLSDEAARKLATNKVEPVIVPGTAPSGALYKIWVAIDSDGMILEEIVSEGPHTLFSPVDRALHQWHFSPIYENGQPRPYRALLVFRVP